MRLNYYFPDRATALEFQTWLDKSRGIRGKIAPALPRYRHGKSPGVSVHWTPGNLVEANEEGQEARRRGGTKWSTEV